MVLQSKRIILGITGSIAAYKSAELTRLLTKSGAQVQVMMTQSATKFVAPLTFQALSGNPVVIDQWQMQANGMDHIGLSRKSDAILVAPASANFIAQAANGLADDLLNTTVLAREVPLLVAPAMNKQMWSNPATQRNVAQLTADGAHILGPASGEQACGEVGEGRMLESIEIFESLMAFFTPKLLQGKRILLTAGPTFEAIDPVRGITNLSSGRMGYALARAAHMAGGDVTLISGPTALDAPQGVRRIDVCSAQQMHDAVMNEVRSKQQAPQLFIAVAAVADYQIKNMSPEKIKKSGKAPELDLVETQDILANVAALDNPPFCVGFAAESSNLEDYATKKRARKKIPMIIGNLVQDALGSEENTLTIFDAAGKHELPRAKKSELAHDLIEHIAKALTKNR